MIEFSVFAKKAVSIKDTEKKKIELNWLLAGAEKYEKY